MSRDCVTHSLAFFLSSAALVYHPEKPQWALGVLDTLLRLCVRVCVHGRTSADKTSHTQARPQNTVGVFPRKLGGSLGLVAGSYGATTGPEI